MNWAKQVLINRDAFGHPMQLAYKGHETYKMAVGGVATLLMRGLIFAASITAITELFQMEDPVIINFE